MEIMESFIYLLNEFSVIEEVIKCGTDFVKPSYWCLCEHFKFRVISGIVSMLLDCVPLYYKKVSSAQKSQNGQAWTWLELSMTVHVILSTVPKWLTWALFLSFRSMLRQNLHSMTTFFLDQLLLFTCEEMKYSNKLFVNIISHQLQNVVCKVMIIILNADADVPRVT